MTDRENIHSHFIEKTTDNFSFLIKDYGFKSEIKQSDLEMAQAFSTVSFFRGDEALDIWYDGLESAIGISLKHSSNTKLNENYALKEILQACQVNDNRLDETRIKNISEMTLTLADMADSLKKHATTIIDLKKETIEQVEALRSTKRNLYVGAAKQAAIDRIRQDSKVNFRQKRYEKVVELLKPIIHDFTETDRKRFDISLKYLDRKL